MTRPREGGHITPPPISAPRGARKTKLRGWVSPKNPFENLTSHSIWGHRSDQVKVDHIGYHSIWGYKTNTLILVSFVYHLWFKSYWQKSNFPIGLGWVEYWLDLGSLKWKIRNIHSVGTHSHTSSWKIENIRIKTVPTPRSSKVWSRSRSAYLILTWPGGLTFWPGNSKFAHKVYSWFVRRYPKFGGARFLDIREKQMGGIICPPPVCVLNYP